MCDFCIKHGEGKKWYLQAKNYGEDLASDIKRRKFIEHFFNEMVAPGPKDAFQGLKRLQSAPPLMRRFMGSLMSRSFKRKHFGQIVPIEDIEKILEICSGIVRTPCVCRRLTRGKDGAFCLGVTISLEKSPFREAVSSDYWEGPDSAGAETMTRDQALDLMRDFERQGLCHSLWTFITPFIGGICNCDRMDCLGLLYTLRGGLKMMWRGEYVARVDPDLCRGCRTCLKNCQFGAISYSVLAQKCAIQEDACWGCGICRAACQQNAISLLDRASVPSVARLW